MAMTCAGAERIRDIRPLVFTDNHMRLPTKEVRYVGNSSLPPGSPLFLVPRSTPGLPGVFEVVEMLYCYYRLNHLEDSVASVTLKRATSVHLEFPEVFHRESLQEAQRDGTSGISASGYSVIFNGDCSMVKGRKGQHRVRVAINEKIVKTTGEDGITIECISARLLKARILNKSDFVTFVAAYAPTEEALKGQKAKHMAALSCTVT